MQEKQLALVNYEAAESALLDTLIEHCEQELKNEKD